MKGLLENGLEVDAYPALPEDGYGWWTSRFDIVPHH